MRLAIVEDNPEVHQLPWQHLGRQEEFAGVVVAAEVFLRELAVALPHRPFCSYPARAAPTCRCCVLACPKPKSPFSPLSKTPAHPPGPLPLHAQQHLAAPLELAVPTARHLLQAASKWPQRATQPHRQRQDLVVSSD